MRTKRPTPGEVRWPSTPEFVALANSWKAAASDVLLELVWRGYDQLQQEVLLQIDWSLACEDIERQITQFLEPLIAEQMTGKEPFYVQHGPYEEELRKLAPAQPPQYDIAFVMRSNLRIMWPLEAKILRTDGSIAEYVKAIATQYLTCRYAPFSREAAMLAYLISGKPSLVLKKVEASLGCPLISSSSFPDRDHAISSHVRTVPVSKNYPANFQCHHLVMCVGKQK